MPIGTSPSASISSRSRSTCCGARLTASSRLVPTATLGERAELGRPPGAHGGDQGCVPAGALAVDPGEARAVDLGHRAALERRRCRRERAHEARAALARHAVVDARDDQQPDRRERERDDDGDGDREAGFERQVPRAHERLRGGTPAPTRSRSDPTARRPSTSLRRRRLACESTVRVRSVAGMRQTSRRRSAFERTAPGSRASSSRRSYSRPESGSTEPAQLARRAEGSSSSSPTRMSAVHAAPAHEQRVHAGDQLGQRERLPQVVVGAALEAAQDVGLLGARRQEEHGRAAVEPIGAAAQPPQDIEARSVRQADVDHRDIGHEVVEQVQRLPERARLADVEALLRKLHRKHVGKLRLVLDE